MTMTAYPVSNLLPREVVPGIHWLGACSDSGAWPGRAGKDVRHEHLSCYVIIGSERTLLVDTGHFSIWKSFHEQLEQALDGRTLDYVFPTHQEIPHAGNLGRLMRAYPNATVVGDTREYHLYFPEIETVRLQRSAAGQRFDLGDREFITLAPVWFDLSGTMWGYDTGVKALFSADGLGYYHEHSPDVCGLLPSETPSDAVVFGILRFALPFVGMKYHDTSGGVSQFRDLTRRHPVSMICSAHGAPQAGAEQIEITERAIGVVEENQISISGPGVVRR